MKCILKERLISKMNWSSRFCRWDEGEADIPRQSNLYFGNLLLCSSFPLLLLIYELRIQHWLIPSGVALEKRSGLGLEINPALN